MRALLLVFSLIFPALVNASYLNETNTVYLIEQDLAGIEVYQKMYYVNADQVIWVREHNLLLSLGKSVELGIKVPYVNQVNRSINFSRLGDVKFHLNFLTGWFKSFGQFNYFVEFNIGNGPRYTELTTHPMEAYGFQELRTGLIFFKRFDYFSIHANLFYVFRNQNELGFFNSFFGDGQTLNIFQKTAWQRGLGFNPNNENTFFYKGNYANDNLEYLLGFNSDLSYPMVPFVEFTFSHAFKPNSAFVQKAPGAGYYRSQITVGTKFFMADDHFVLKLAFMLPVLDLRNSHSFGAGAGVRIDF